MGSSKRSLEASDGLSGDGFGYSVAISGTTVMVGAVLDDINGNAEQGSAYVFVYEACPPITLDPASLPNGTVGSPYRQNITASGGAAPLQLRTRVRRVAAGVDAQAHNRCAHRQADGDRDVQLHDHGNGR